jgi:hypothetical protein
MNSRYVAVRPFNELENSQCSHRRVAKQSGTVAPDGPLRISCYLSWLVGKGVSLEKIRHDFDTFSAKVCPSLGEAALCLYMCVLVKVHNT